MLQQKILQVNLRARQLRFRTPRHEFANVTIMRALPLLLASFVPGVASAHAGEKGLIMLLPTKLFMVAGTLIVVVSFLLTLRLPLAGIHRHLTHERQLLSWTSGRGSRWLSAASLLFVLFLITSGFNGSTDPLKNPIGSVIWAWFWVGLVFVHVVIGNLWSLINPWIALERLIDKPLKAFRLRSPLLPYPAVFGYWPAVLLLLAILWFENVSLAPYDPTVLARAVSGYVILTAIGIALFGRRAWIRHGELFSVYFRMTSMLAPLQIRPDETPEAGGRRQLALAWPWMNLLRVERISTSGVVFILCALAGVTFDGLAHTFWWLGRVGINPLEFGGRSTVYTVNTIGLPLTCLVLVLLYYLSTIAGARVGGRSLREPSVNRFVFSLIPIAFGYHFAHYLPAFSLESQYALVALSDPFGLGWNLFGTGDMTVVASVRTSFTLVTFIWYTQVTVIVIAHVVAILIAHLIAYEEYRRDRDVLYSQLPLTGLMIFYTFLGLWLLSTPGV